MTGFPTSAPTKALVVYESMFGNTELVAQAIAEGLRAALPVDLVDVDEAPHRVSEDVALLVVGGPTHAFSMSRPQTRDDAVTRGAPHSRKQGLREWLSQLPRTDHSPQVAVFDTRATQVRHLPGSAARAAARVLRSHGYRASDRASFYVSDIAGPLTVGEAERARAWGESLGAETVRNQT